MTALFWPRFAAVARAHAERVAVEDGAASRSYGALAARSARIGAALVARDLGPERTVGVALPRSLAWIEAVLAIWWARAAFVPLDPSLPPARRARLAADAACALVVDEAALAALHDAGGDLDPPLPAPADLAYIIFTSGSTGAPKGVLVEQRGLVPLLDAQIAAFGLRPGARPLWALSPAFDASLSDVGTALLAGATLVVERGALSPATCARLGELRITHADLPPALLRVLDPTALPPTLETLVVGGEPSDPALLRRFAARTRVVNVYGPTEATVCTHLCVVGPDWDRPLLGAPLPSVRERLDGDELLLGGAQLARGYLDPEATRARFFDADGARWYRTGDRVERLPDGRLAFLGRGDRQLKLRGRLIAPEEVEATLLADERVAAAAVLARPLADGARPSLVAFVVARAPFAPADLLTRAAATLPTWMVPARIELLPTLPRLASGKPDLAALAAYPLAPPTTFVAPRTDTERALVAAFEQALRIHPLGVTEPLAAWGADSLTALEAAATLATAGHPLSPALLLAHPTIEAIATAEQGHELPRNLLIPPAIYEQVTKRAAPPRAHPSCLLLTGATGHVGRALTGALARTFPEARRLRLVRGRPAPLAGWEDVRGDLALPRLGLDDATWNALADAPDLVVHAGATVDLLRPFAALRAVNVEGTRTLLTLAAQGRPKRLHHLSSLDVLLAATPRRGDEDDDLSTHQTVAGGYAQSKWAAEALLRADAGRAAPIAIHRLGLWAGAPHDLLARFIRGVAALGALPDDADERVFDLTPPPAGAAALAWLIARPLDAGVTTFHVAHPRPVPFAALAAALTDEGVALRRLSRDAFDALPTPAVDPADLAVARHSLAAHPSGALSLFIDAPLACARTHARLPPALADALATTRDLRALVRTALASIGARS